MDEAADCGSHGQPISKNCIKCRRPLCDSCHRYDINGRPWCFRCGQEQVPAETTLIQDALKAAALVVITTAPFFLFTLAFGMMLKVGLLAVP